MAEVFRSAPPAAGLSESLAIIVKWRDLPTPLSEEDFATAIHELEGVVGTLTGKTDPTARSALAMARTVLGNLHRDHGLIDHAAPFYDAALANPADLDDGTPRGKNERANGLTQRGLCRLAGSDEESLTAALADFDEAIALRRELPPEDEDAFRWSIANNLLNRGDLLQRLDRNDEARVAYDEAIARLRELPHHENATTLQRLAMAIANRGLVAVDHDEARQCFQSCIDLLPSPRDPAQLLTLCSALLNRGRHALQVMDDPDATAGDARRVLERIGPHEKEHPAPAQLALQARHLLAHALCRGLDDSRRGPGGEGDRISDATDAVEEALELDRHWAQQGFEGLRPLACELFQLGLHVYRVRQPHFLAEFLVESMDPELSPGAPFRNARFQSAAAAALRQALDETVKRVAAAAHEPETAAKQAKILRSLRAADQRLAAVQQAMAGH